MPLDSLITRDADVMSGTPVFRGTRVPARTLFDYLARGASLEEFLSDFPTVSREVATAVLHQSCTLVLRHAVAGARLTQDTLAV